MVETVRGHILGYLAKIGSRPLGGILQSCSAIKTNCDFPRCGEVTETKIRVEEGGEKTGDAG